MTETTCAACGSEGNSQWRIRLERGADATGRETSYRLCRGCWERFREDFSVSETEPPSKTPSDDEQPSGSESP